jgi:hypothetical protein
VKSCPKTSVSGGNPAADPAGWEQDPENAGFPDPVQPTIMEPVNVYVVDWYIYGRWSGSINVLSDITLTVEKSYIFPVFHFQYSYISYYIFDIFT